jgi:outer membrane protein OmpA-like peptidoglycan-associated protein
MSDAADDNQNLILAIVMAIIAAVVAGVITLAASRAFSKPTAAPSVATAPVAVAADRLYFEVGSADLPADAATVLARVADAARAGTQQVLISGFHDETGDALQNAELAKNRALAVKHALEANGVAPDRLVMSKPEVTTGGTDPREARRVELRLQ